MEHLTGKVAVVTGAAKGLGYALAKALADEGVRVVLADIDQAGLEAAVQQLRDGGADAVGLRTDVSDTDSIERLRDFAFEHFDRVHVLCNNAGVGGGGPVTEPVDLGQWNSVFAINLFGAVRGVNAFLPAMLEQGEGHIVNTASRAGLLPLPDLGAYVPSKFALVAYSEMLHAELARSAAGVGVTVLTPSGLRTPMLLDSFAAIEKMAAEDPALAEYGQTLLANAVEPDAFARLVIRAVKQDCLYVNSHAATLGLVQERVDRMLAATNMVGTVG